MGKGQDLYIKAKQLIPGGVQLLSKRPNSSYPTNGRLITAKRKVVKFGIWTGRNTLI